VLGLFDGLFFFAFGFLGVSVGLGFLFNFCNFFQPLRNAMKASKKVYEQCGKQENHIPESRFDKINSQNF